jgi:hypothetical protein
VAWETPAQAAQELMRTQGRDQDDCTVVVVRTADDAR